MGEKRIAVAVVHGIGKQLLAPEDDPDRLTFSRKLHDRVRNTFSRRGRFPRERDFADLVAWGEVNYAHIFNDVQSQYFGRLGKRINKSRIRQLVVENIGDAAAYRPAKAYDPLDPRTYDRVHACIAATLERLEAQVTPDAPLIVLAHSLGGHVTSNYLWDCQSRKFDAQPLQKGLTDFQKGRRLSHFITFGCNIPLFLFGLDAKHVQALPFPEVQCEDKYRSGPWWRNYYDKDDVLGYPLRPSGDGYQAMADRQELRDVEINAGNFLASWNFMSHTSYWKDRDFVRPVAEIISDVLRAAEPGGLDRGRR